MKMCTGVPMYSLLLIVGTLILQGEADCSRRYTSSEPDCSKAKLPDGSLADGHIPCFSFDGNGLPTQLEFPDDNAQTCYRTCIDSDRRRCEASLISTIHNKDLVVGADFKLWVFSQGFLRSSNQKYRKSSICRYNIQCPAGQILSYSIDFHTIEEAASCGTSGMSCLDSLTLFFPGMASQVTSCGTKDASSTNSDGSPNLLLEFMSNRKTEKNGFLLLAWCVDPNSQGSSRDTRAVGENRCNVAAGWGKNQRKNESAALQHLADAFTAHSKKILAPSAIHITVDVFGHVSYVNMTINIIHPNGTVDTFPGITSFHLANRFINDETVFRKSAPEKYHGYGYIVMWRSQAFFLQAGMNPEFRPTTEEEKLIEEFQNGLKEAAIQSLSAEDDAEWEEDEEETIWPSQWTSTTTTSTAEPSPSPSWTASETDDKTSGTTTTTWHPSSTKATENLSPTADTTDGTTGSWSPTTDSTTGSWSPTTEGTTGSWPSTTESTTGSWPSTTEGTTGSWPSTTESTTGSWSPTTDDTTGSLSPTTESTTESWSPTTDGTTESWSPTTEGTTGSLSPTTESTTESWSPTTDGTTGSLSPTTEGTTESWSPITDGNTGSWSPSTESSTTSPPSLSHSDPSTDGDDSWGTTLQPSETQRPTAETWSQPSTEASQASTSWEPTSSPPNTTSWQPAPTNTITETGDTITQTSEASWGTSSMTAETAESWSTPSTTTETAISWSTPSTTTQTTGTSWGTPSTTTETAESWSTPSNSHEETTSTSWSDQGGTSTTENSQPTQSSTTTNTQSWRDSLTDHQRLLLVKAKFYSTACNALLRSVACAYLKLVGGENCPTVSAATTHN